MSDQKVLVPSGVAEIVRTVETAAYGPFEPISAADRARYQGQFAASFPNLSGILTNTGQRLAS